MRARRAAGRVAGRVAVSGESPGDQVTVFSGHHGEASQHHSRQWSQDVPASGAGAVTLTPCHE